MPESRQHDSTTWPVRPPTRFDDIAMFFADDPSLAESAHARFRSDRLVARRRSIFTIDDVKERMTSTI